MVHFTTVYTLHHVWKCYPPKTGWCLWAHIIRPYGRRVTMQGKTKGRNKGKAKSKEEQYWCWCSPCPTMPSIPTNCSPCRKRSPSTWQTLTKPPSKARRLRHRVLVRPMVIASPGGRVYNSLQTNHWKNRLQYSIRHDSIFNNISHQWNHGTQTVSRCFCSWRGAGPKRTPPSSAQQFQHLSLQFWHLSLLSSFFG